MASLFSPNETVVTKATVYFVFCYSNLALL